MYRGAIVALLVGLVSLVGMAPIGAQTNGLSYSEETVVTVEDGIVLVETSATMVNTTVDRVEGNTVFFSFFDSLPLVVPVDAQNVTVTSQGASLSSTVTPLDDDFELREFALPSQLRSGESRNVTISFELPAGDPRGDGLFISNAAYSSFPLWSNSDPGQGSLELRVPVGVGLNDIGDSLRRVDQVDGFAIYEPINFARPQDLFAYVVVTDSSRLERRELNVIGQEIEINYWPGDRVWADFADQTITTGLPALQAQIGLGIPDQGTLQVNESATPYFFGYGGWYDEADTSIDIGNVLNETVMLHELSHAWFNSDLFIDRWISEGLAEDFTWRTQGELDSDQELAPSEPQLSNRGSLPLAEWTSSGTGATNSQEFQDREAYAYDASWFVVRSITEAIGLEDMQAVFAQADQNRHAYEASQFLPLSPGEDWRRFLDLVSEHATPEEEEQVEALFINFIVPESDVSDFDRRRSARTDFELLTERDPGWDLPLELRNAMARWDFESAEGFLQQARPIQDRYLQIEAAIEGTSLEVSDSAQQAYESGPGEWDRVMELLDQQLLSVQALADLEEDLVESSSFRQSVGLWGVNPSNLLDDARVALAADDFDGANAATSEAQDALANAERTGTTRLGIGGFVALLAGAGLTHRRRKRLSSHEDPNFVEENQEDGLRDALGLLAVVAEDPDRELDQDIAA